MPVALEDEGATISVTNAFGDPFRLVVDHSARWAKLEAVCSVNGEVEERLTVFCATKQISIAGLEALGAHVRIGVGNKVELASQARTTPDA